MIYTQHWAFEFKTSKLNSLIAKDSANANLGTFAYSIFNSSDAEITDVANEGNATLTRIDWTIPFDLTLQGGEIFKETISHDIRAFVVMDYGGYNIEFLSGLNLKLIPSGFSFNTPQLLDITQNPIGNTDRLTMLLKHDEGVVYQIQGLLKFIRK